MIQVVLLNGFHQVNKDDRQTAMELIRQHLDCGGFHCPYKRQWSSMPSVKYLITMGTKLPFDYPTPKHRLVGHFATFNVPSPTYVT